MSTASANFRSALSNYHAALISYQGFVEAIEAVATEKQRDGRAALERVNLAALDAGARATCLIRATVDAEIVALDASTGAQAPDKTTVKYAIAILESRLSLLEQAKRALHEATKALEAQLDGAMTAAQSAKCALTPHCADDE